jgi:uncharacterized protein
MSLDSNPAIGPIEEQGRIQIVDVLRGFAIFGILVVNMGAFGAPVYQYVTDVELFRGAADRAAQWMIRFLAQGKFYSLFSFLFGLGFSIQMMRAESRGASFMPLYRRRLLALLAIGLAHAFLIWFGDILVTYAVLGLLLPLFRRRSDRTLFVWSVVLMLLPVLLYGSLAGVIELARASPEMAAKIEQVFAESEALNQRRLETALRVYATGGWKEIHAQRSADVLYLYSVAPFRNLPSIVAMFLLGLWAGRRRIFEDLGARRELARKMLRWGIPFAIAGNLIYTVASGMSSLAKPSWMGTLGKAGFAFGGPALCFVYIAAIVLLFERERWRAQLVPLAAVGRTALSNYLLQSVICTAIFNGYGLGLYGTVGPALGLFIAIAIFAAQIPLSQWWLAAFRFGPAEWLWRSLTYGRLQPLRR